MAYEQDVIALRRDVDNLSRNSGSNITTEQILEALLTIDGSDSGLDADKLDGYHYNEILSLINAKLDSSLYTASDILNKLLTVDGSESGLDADKLDGYEASEFLLNNVYTAADILSKLLTVDGSGSGLDADKLDGNEASVFLQSSSYTAADILSKLLTVDGSGSGLDADTLDGTHLSTLNNNIANKVRYGSVTVANVSANTAGTVNVTISATPSLSQIICFVIGGNQGTAQISDVSGTTYTIRYKFEATGTNRQIYFVYFT